MFTFVNKAKLLIKEKYEEINMTSSNNSTINDSGQYRFKRKGCCTKGNWSGINIAAMVIGFIVFWPLGLLILYWNIKGRNVKDLPRAVQQKWSAMVNGSWSPSNNIDSSNGENTVFDEYQQTQYDRIVEIKDEIKNRARSFSDFRSNAKRRADEDEFQEFMSSDRSKDDK